MKLNPKSENYEHHKQFSHLYPDIQLDKMDELRCEICQTIMGKYSVSDTYGFIAICDECIEASQ